jgi:hypothetical protein
MYAETDTFVRLFERVGFISDYGAARPTEPMTILRGVTDTPAWLARGMSWTTDLDKARWFSHRLDHLLDPQLKRLGTITVPQPTVWSAEIAPEGVLALFYEQNELEVVVNPRRLRHLRVIEQAAPVWPPEERLD